MKAFALTPLVIALLCASCEKRSGTVPEATSEPASFSTPGRTWSDSEFTSWMSRAELQYRQETNPADQYFSRVEARKHDGAMQYRAVVRPFPSDLYDQWAVFWGIGDAELFDWELRLLKGGFVRDNMQVCKDPEGRMRHQIVWLKPKDSGDAEDPRPVITAEQAIAGQSLPVEEPATEPEISTPAIVPVPEAVEEEAVPKVKTTTYVVKPGDTLGKIAKTKGTTVADLKSLNHLKNDIVRIGQKLEVPAKK